jgi:RNA polymerase sigma-70 factor (ECF subfamily)
MSFDAETRPSLIRRVQSGDDAAAWDEFSSIYRPVIIRLAMARGLQPADAEDLAQQVLMSVSRNIRKWNQDPSRARFRTWLQKVVRNATLNALSRSPKDAATGGTDALTRLGAVPDDSSENFDQEWRRGTLQWAVQQVRGEFQKATWDAFWLTAVDGVSPEDAAKQTGKSLGAVYIARTRVMQQIRARVAELLEEES